MEKKSMKVFVSNDWKVISFSKELVAKFEQISGKKITKLSFSELRTNDLIIELLQQMGGNSFDESHDGVVIVEFDDKFVHPIIEEEEFGGEKLSWGDGSFKDFGIERDHCYTYNPMDPTFKSSEEGYYNPGDDSYNPAVGCNQYVGEVTVIEGSSKIIERLIEEAPDVAKNYAQKISKYSSVKVSTVKELLSLSTEAEIKSYFYMWAGTCINRDCILALAKIFTSDQIFCSRDNLVNYLKKNSFEDLCKKFSLVPEQKCERRLIF
jgi:hypothetical protein